MLATLRVLPTQALLLIIEWAHEQAVAPRWEVGSRSLVAGEWDSCVHRRRERSRGSTKIRKELRGHRIEQTNNPKRGSNGMRYSRRTLAGLMVSLELFSGVSLAGPIRARRTPKQVATPCMELRVPFNLPAIRHAVDHDYEPEHLEVFSCRLTAVLDHMPSIRTFSASEDALRIRCARILICMSVSLDYWHLLATYPALDAAVRGFQWRQSAIISPPRTRDVEVSQKQAIRTAFDHCAEGALLRWASEAAKQAVGAMGLETLHRDTLGSIYQCGIWLVAESAAQETIRQLFRGGGGSECPSCECIGGIAYRSAEWAAQILLGEQLRQWVIQIVVNQPGRAFITGELTVFSSLRRWQAFKNVHFGLESSEQIRCHFLKPWLQQVDRLVAHLESRRTAVSASSSSDQLNLETILDESINPPESTRANHAGGA